MKVTNKNRKFYPVEIVLESKQELDIFLKIINNEQVPQNLTYDDKIKQLMVERFNDLKFD